MTIKSVSNTILVAAVLASLFSGVGQASELPETDQRYLNGKRIFSEGMLPSGIYISATIHDDIQVTGDQLICASCHRRSGMGTLEGQQVVPAIAGKILFSPLRLPTSQQPSTPIQRPAYTRETLKLAITQGIDANGVSLDPFMPRYRISDSELDSLIVYLKRLSNELDPGVTDSEVHFSTIIHEENPAAVNNALLGVLTAYFEQKNSESRHESSRAEHAPWHKEWIMKTYRKWRLHVWTLKGKPDSWGAQLRDYYRQQPVFAVLNGYIKGDFEPVHRFCEENAVPCLFPTTYQPVLEEGHFYTFYLNRGYSFEGEAMASYLNENYPQQPILEISESSSRAASIASLGLQEHLNVKGYESIFQGCTMADTPDIDVVKKASVSGIVLFMNKACTDALLQRISQMGIDKPLFLSTRLYGTELADIPEPLKSHVRLVHTREMPDLTEWRLARSTGWLKHKKAYDPEQKEVQANAYFSLKIVGDAMTHIRGYFYRDYLLEKIEHAIDDAPYTSIYPRLSLAPGESGTARFSIDPEMLQAVNDAGERQYIKGVHTLQAGGVSPGKRGQELTGQPLKTARFEIR